jgi:hypothetical protein
LIASIFIVVLVVVLVLVLFGFSPAAIKDNIEKYRK